MNAQLVALIKKHFKQRLQAKTGWGRNDLWQEFEAAINDALLEYIDHAASFKTVEISETLRPDSVLYAGAQRCPWE